MTNYYQIPVTVSGGVYDYGVDSADFIESPVLDGYIPPRQAMIAVAETLTIGTAITEAQYNAGFPTADPATLSVADFMALLQSAGGMTQNQYAAYITDQSAAMVIMRYEIALPPATVDRDDPQTTANMAALVTAGHLPSTGPAAVVAAWPSAASYNQR